MQIKVLHNVIFHLFDEQKYPEMWIFNAGKDAENTNGVTFLEKPTAHSFFSSLMGPESPFSYSFPA